MTPRARHRVAGLLGATLWALVLAMLLAGCAGPGRLSYVAETVSPVPKDSTVRDVEGRTRTIQTWRPMFSDTLIGLVPATGDTAKRYLGRLRDGYAADTLNVIMFGDNRPGWRSTRLQPEYATISRMFSLNPVKVVKGLVTIPILLVKGLFPDLAILRDIPGKLRNQPTWGREKQVMSGIMTKIDSLHARGQNVAAVINTGDLVEDGRCPQHWERFLRLNQPLTSRVPYFAVAGNHERTDTELGLANWRTATGLPVGGDRMYYCFDTADGWLRFIALDSNPIVDPDNLWSRDVQISYSDEQFTWLVNCIKEHRGPVVVMMHHPPLSAGFHRDEWQSDPMLRERRDRMVTALHETGISIIASGHEHAYQRALLTWPDAVLVAIVTGGGGAPLHAIPASAQAAVIYAENHVAGGVIKPQNVFTASVFNFTLLRLWFGGGEVYSYAVDQKAKLTQIDQVQIDLNRYGIPKIDQHKIPLPPAKGPSEPVENEMKKPAAAAVKADSTSAGERLMAKPPPGKKKPAPAKKPTPTKKPTP